MSKEHPGGLRYTKDHEWARVDGNTVTVGITQFAVEQLGDITQIDLPREGESVTKGSVFGTVESVKAVSDLFAPISGKVLKVNDPLKDSPETLNEDCYDEGWMITVEAANTADIDQLMTAQAYEEYLRDHG